MNKEQIGSFIYNERKKQQLSQKALAEKAGITRYQQIIEIEKAQYDYGIDVLIKVTRALGFGVSLNPPLNEVRLVCNNGMNFDFSKVESAKEESSVHKKKAFTKREPIKKVNTKQSFTKTKNKSHA
jgi:transcriptional regulator with XRE-family HTH domain